MNIDNKIYTNNFKARHLLIVRPENFPQKILNEIEQNRNINNFIKEGNEISFLTRIKNAFRNFLGKNNPEQEEVLEISYNSKRNLNENGINTDPFNKTVEVTFNLKQIGKTEQQYKPFYISFTQKGTQIEKVSQHFNTVYTYYEPPRLKAEDVLLRKIHSMLDLNRLFQILNK